MAVEIKKIILRQGTEAERKQITLDSGEPGFCTDSNRLYIGNGTGGGAPVGTNNLGFVTFTGNDTNISSSLAPVSGDFVFDTSSNLTYMLTGTNFAKTSAFKAFGSQFTVDNNTIVLQSNIASVADNSLFPVKLNASSVGAGLERINFNTVLKTKVGSSITYDAGGGMIVANNSLANATLVNAPANTVKGRLNSVGPVQDLTLNDLATLLTGIFTTVPIGTIIDWAGASTSIPSTYLECIGQQVSRTTYATLFAVLSTTWGSGNGTTTFNLPDLRRKVTAGAGGSSSATLLNTVGSTGGSETHILSANEGKCEFDVSATFQQVQAGSTSSGFLGGLTITNKGNIDFTAGPTAPIATVTGTVGSSEADPHNIVQPTAIVRKLIKATA